MGENMKINDYVTRKKYNHDILFRIVRIEGKKVELQGVNLRLKATANLDDLKIADPHQENYTEPLLSETRNANILKGKILHLDGDKKYLEKCLKVYKENGINADGYYLKENEMKHQITNLLIKHKPDVLVITGHDSINEVGENMNTEHFVSCVKNARICMPDKDSLVIFAGACQSEYKKIIESGANFASSINRENIHILDPVYIAIQVASTPVREYVDVDKVLKKTISKGKGLGGIDTRGVARRNYGG